MSGDRNIKYISIKFNDVFLLASFRCAPVIMGALSNNLPKEWASSCMTIPGCQQPAAKDIELMRPLEYPTGDEHLSKRKTTEKESI